MSGYKNLCVNCMGEMGEAEVCPHCGFSVQKPQMPHALPYKTILQNRYVVGKALKSNGEGITYIGYDTVLNIKVELREFFPQTMCERLENTVDVRILSGNEIVFDECLASFLNYAREVAHMRELSAIEQIYDIFEENHTAYKVYEWQESITLRYFVERSGGFLDWNTARQLFMPVLSALEKLHMKGINHLGISPDCLVILQDGKMQLRDFYIDAVRQMDTDLPPDITPGCAAIEQYVMDYKPTESTDVYAFTASLFFALTGVLPQDALKRKTDSRLLIPTSILKTLPPHVITALANGLQVLPEKRTATFERLRDELSASPAITATIEMEQALRDIPEPYAVEKEEKRRVPNFVWALCSCLIALAVFSGIGFLWFSQVAEEEPVESSMTDEVSASLPTTVSSQISSESSVDNTSRLLMVDVPNLVDQNYEDLLEANEAAGESNYQILLSEKTFSDTVPEGCIISQEPQAGEKMEKGSIIVVTVSEGAAIRTLPDIRNLTLAEASAKVSEAGFTPTKSEVYDDTVPAGKMIGYKDANAGDQLNYGAQVIMLMSKGPENSYATPGEQSEESTSQE